MTLDNREIGDIPIRKRDASTIADVQMVFQNPFDTLNPSMTVGRQITRALEIFGIGKTEAARREKMLDLLDLVKLPREFADRMPRQLSGGQKQRVGIARAFAGGARIVVADEPVSALDVSVQAAVADLLMEIQRNERTTLLFISHDLSIVRYLSDRVLVMYLGHVVEIGDTSEVFAPPYHPYTEALLSAVPIADTRVKKKHIVLAGDVPSAMDPPPGCPFQTRCRWKSRVPGDRCETIVPPMVRFGSGGAHQIKCHLTREELEGMEPVMGFASEDYGYAVDLGLPIPSTTMFGLDPEVKAEAVWVGDRLTPRSAIASRRGPAVAAVDDRGHRAALPLRLPPYDSMLMQAADPAPLPELLDLRERMRGWRFYDHFRTDPEAPARSARVGTRSPVLAADGADLAAAFQTIREIGDGSALNAAVEDAFPGARAEVVGEAAGRLELRMHQHGLLWPLEAAELSDGTLRYLVLVTALLTPRPPGLMVLNEPETSPHPDLLPALARLITQAAEGCQMIVVTHAKGLADELAAAGALGHELEKSLGETIVPAAERPEWNWPTR